MSSVQQSLRVLVTGANRGIGLQLVRNRIYFSVFLYCDDDSGIVINPPRCPSLNFSALSPALDADTRVVEA